MKMIIAAAVFVCASCTTSQPEQHQDVLPTDAYYIIVTPECAASNELELCASELGFCTDGTYAAVYPGEADGGSYTIDNGLAVDTLNGFAFDFTTQQIVESGTAYTTPWSTATGDENTLVVCGD
jgi:hypothetical protein